jgi:ligand-binding sensor domain-containing protein
MKDYNTHKAIYSLLLMLFFINYCNGQNKSQSQEIIKEPHMVPKAQPKIIKPQGNNREDNIHCGLQDKAGNLWFGSAGEGVYFYDGKNFTNFTTKDGLTNNIVWSILEDNTGNIWFGTSEGICRYDTRGRTFMSIPIIVPNGRYLHPYTSTNNPSAKNDVSSIMQDKSGKLWFGTTDGVYCYNPLQNDVVGQGIYFTRFLDHDGIINKSGLHLRQVQCILEDKNGNIWFGSGPGEGEGVCRYDGKSITSFKPNGDVWVRSILEDKHGNLWFGGRHHGICVYDGKTFTDFTEKKHFSKPIYSIPSLLEDKAGNIWFANESSGVWCYDGRTLKNFTTDDGLINNSVWCIVQDREGKIWVGTRNNGLSRFDGRLHNPIGQEKAFTSFTE